MSPKFMHKLLSILIFSFTLISFFEDKIKQIKIPLSPPLKKGELKAGMLSSYVFHISFSIIFSKKINIT